MPAGSRYAIFNEDVRANMIAQRLDALSNHP